MKRSKSIFLVLPTIAFLPLPTLRMPMNSPVYTQPAEPAPPVTQDNFILRVPSEEGKGYYLNLKKADKGTLHPKLKYFSVQTDPETGVPVLDPWEPKEEEVQNSQDNIYTDPEHGAVIRASSDEHGHRVLEGVIDGQKFIETRGVSVLSPLESMEATDYIDSTEPLTYNERTAQPETNVVELALVCSKTVGDIFAHDSKKIMDYWALSMVDINMRYKSLKSVAISLRVTVILVLKENPPFIWTARNRTSGILDDGLVLKQFTQWIWAQKSKLPRFDTAVLAIKDKCRYNGLGYLRGTCKEEKGAGIMICFQLYTNNANAFAHELGHNLGAPHDNEVKPPCAHVGFVMGGSSPQKKHWFSECSDREISKFIKSDQAACLRRLDNEGKPEIFEDYWGFEPVSMVSQCARLQNLSESQVVVSKTDNCTKVICSTMEKGKMGRSLYPAENSVCNSGICFRGRCIPVGSVLKNEGGQCLLSSERLSGQDVPKMGECPKTPSPLEKFATKQVATGYLLKVPYSTFQGEENDDKCLYLKQVDIGLVAFIPCTKLKSGGEWLLEDVGEGQVLVKEVGSKRCLKQEASQVKALPEGDCDPKEKTVRWSIKLSKE